MQPDVNLLAAKLGLLSTGATDAFTLDGLKL
jgi:hypothetical protein